MCVRVRTCVPAADICPPPATLHGSDDPPSSSSSSSSLSSYLETQRRRRQRCSFGVGNPSRRPIYSGPVHDDPASPLVATRRRWHPPTADLFVPHGFLHACRPSRISRVKICSLMTCEPGISPQKNLEK